MPLADTSVGAVPPDESAGAELLPSATVCATVVGVERDDVLEHPAPTRRTMRRVEHRRAQSIRSRTLAVHRRRLRDVERTTKSV
jgi:hypothetical protein